MGFSKHDRDLSGEKAWNPDDRVLGKTLRKLGMKATAANMDMARQQLRVDRSAADGFEGRLRDAAARERARRQ